MIKVYFLIPILFLTLLLGFSLDVVAQETTEYTLLAPIPLQGGGVDETISAGPYIGGIFRLMIAIAGVLAVVMLIFGGIKYMSTDAFGEKNEARTTIENALWGLILAIASWLIIFTINPSLVEFNLEIPIQKIEAPATSTTAAVSTSGLQQSTANAVAGLEQECNCSVRITSAAGGSHDPNSLHYQGLAVDIGADSDLTEFLTGQNTNPERCSVYLKTLNGVVARFLWEPTGSSCGGAVNSTGDHWHMSIIQ